MATLNSAEHPEPQAFAFLRMDSGVFKIYDKGQDWKVIGPNGYERWHSQWTRGLEQSSIPWNGSLKQASLHRAVFATPGGSLEHLRYTQKAIEDHPN